MKRIIIITISFLFCSINLIFSQPQYTLVTNVKTPNNSTVQDTYVLTSADTVCSSPQLAALAYSLDINYNHAELIEAPSYKYNCHGYAWHVSEGGNKVWIGKDYVTSEDIYWTDRSYIEVPESIATKVSYHQDGNHSAIRLNSDWYQSKWGSGGALVKHHPNDVPIVYKPLMPKKYYIRTPIITGTALFCSGSSGTFTVTNAPAGFVWDKSSNLTITGTGNSVSVSASGLSYSYAVDWIGIKYNGILIVKKEVWVGAPAISSIDGPWSPPSNTTTRYTAKYNNSSNPTSFEWVLNPTNSGCFIYKYGQYADVSLAAGSYQLLCRATNACGTGNYYGISLSTARGGSGSPFSYNVYPNPASNLLYIEIGTEANPAADSRNAQTATTTYDIRLYNDQGHALRHTTTHGGTVHLNVSHLHNGNYFLHIISNVNTTPQVMQIMVKH